MTLSLILALLWLVLANVIGALPSKHHHWPSAYVLIAIGLPILGFVFWENNIWIGLIVLEWPVPSCAGRFVICFAGLDDSLDRKPGRGRCPRDSSTS